MKGGGRGRHISALFGRLQSTLCPFDKLQHYQVLLLFVSSLEYIRGEKRKLLAIDTIYDHLILLPPEALGGKSVLASSSSSWLFAFLGCGCLTPIFASLTILSAPLLCVSLTEILVVGH